MPNINQATKNLFKAIAEDNITAVTAAIAAEADINYVLPNMEIVSGVQPTIEQQEILDIFSLKKPIQDLFTNNPLLLALSLERLEIAQYLLNLPNIDLNHSNQFGINALHMLAMCGHDRGKRVSLAYDGPSMYTKLSDQEIQYRLNLMIEILEILVKKNPQLLKQPMDKTFGDIPCAIECCNRNGIYKEFFKKLTEYTTIHVDIIELKELLNGKNMCEGTYDPNLLEFYLAKNLGFISKSVLISIAKKHPVEYFKKIFEDIKSNLTAQDFEYILRMMRASIMEIDVLMDSDQILKIQELSKKLEVILNGALDGKSLLLSSKQYADACGDLVETLLKKDTYQYDDHIAVKQEKFSPIVELYKAKLPLYITEEEDKKRIIYSFNKLRI